MPTPYEEGSPDSPICLLGEAPSFMELRESRPFVGPAGQLLERCLHAAGIVRAACYITNVFDDEIKKPRDDNNKIVSKDGSTLLWTSGKGFTPAGLEASKPCRERLARCSANVIVPLGAPALSLALGEPRPITKWRGSILAGIGDRKLVPTIHPSACLRGTYEWRYLVVADLKKARRESASPALCLPKRDLIVDPTYEQAVSFLKDTLDARLFDTDIELLHGNVDCFSISLDPLRAISIPLVDTGFEPRFSPDEERTIWDLYGRAISDPRITKVNQNITFDLAILLQLNNIIPAGRIEDPMVAHSVMNPFLEKNLGTICSLYTDEPYYKDDGTLHDSPTVADFTRRWEYNAKDAAIALESWLALEPMLDRDGYRQTYEMTTQLVPSLLEMMVGGIKVNASALKAAKGKAETDLAALVARMEPAFGRRIITEAPKTAAQKRAAAGALNINSPAQLSQYFYVDKGLKPYKGKNDKPTTDDTAMARIARRDNLEEARLLQQYRKIAKNLSTYLSVRYDEDGRLRSSMNIRGAWTGRLSSSQTVFGGGLNFQNLPEDFTSFLESDHENAA